MNTHLRREVGVGVIPVRAGMGPGVCIYMRKEGAKAHRCINRELEKDSEPGVSLGGVCC